MSAAATFDSLRRRRFKPVDAQGRYVPELEDAKGASGVYAIWSESGALRYIGESHSGRLYDTLTRHFRRWSGPNPTYDRSRVRVAFTTRPADPEATQARLITHAQPPDNVECIDEDNRCAMPNPPRKTRKNQTRKKAARRRPTKPTARKKTSRRRSSAARGSPKQKLEVEKLGSPREILYKGTDGQLYRHKFSQQARLLATADGRHLIIDGVKVRGFITG